MPVQPQAVLEPITEAAIFLTLTVDPGAEAQVRDTLGAVSGLRRSVGFRIPEARLSCVVGIGSDLWDRMLTAPRPVDLHPFEELVFGDATPACPRCAAAEVDKVLSAFAVGASGSGAEMGACGAPCGSCGDPRGPGACGMN